MLRQLLHFVLGCVGIGACWYGWWVVYQDSTERAAVAVEKKTSKPMAVEVVTADGETFLARVRLAGSLAASTQTEVRARVSGYIDSLLVDVGDHVTRGDVLIRLDDATQREAVAQAEATLNVAKAQLEAQRTEHALAQKVVDRQSKLAVSGAVTAQQLEAAEAALEIAAARISLEEARVTEAEANLLATRLELEELTLTAPIDGVVASRLADVGDLAKPEEAILTIVNLDTVQTTVHVVEKDYRRIKIGQRSDVTVDAFPGLTFEGEVRRISPILDPSTRTAEVHIDVSNPRHLLKPGMYARVWLESQDSRQGVTVPIAALLESDTESSVFVLDEKSETVSKRVVRPGAVRGDTLIIADGVAPGEQVVTLGSRLVKDGQRVAVEHVEWSAPQPTELREENTSSAGAAE